MSKFLRVGIVGVIAAAAAFGGVARAVDTLLPTEFESGGVLWGDLTGDDTGFYNDGSICLGSSGFAMGDAELVATGQDDAFDDAGMVNIDGSYFVVPGGLNGPVDLTGATLQSPTATTGPLDVSVQWQGAGPGTIRELVSLTNSGASDFAQEVVIETNLGSDDSTTLEASSTGDISGYPTDARWFATSDDDNSDDDPPIVSVATGPGTVQSPGTILDCPFIDSLTAKQAEKDAKDADATEAPTPDVAATGTLLDTDNFTYHYNVAIPAGQTRYLMVFWSLHSTIAEVVASGPAWDTNPTAGSEELAGITPEQLSLIVNWAFPLAPAPLAVSPRFTG